MRKTLSSRPSLRDKGGKGELREESMNRFMIGVVRDALFSGSRGGTGMTPDSTPLNGGGETTTVAVNPQ